MCEVDPGDYHGEVGHSLVIEGLDIEDDKSIVSGETWMFADGATIVGHTIEIPTNELPSFQTSETPSLEMKTKTTGVRTMLAVLIETDDYKAPMTAAQLKNQLWFDPVSLYKQYKACSFDQLVFDPTLLAYPLGGVVRVVLDGKKAEGQSHDTVSNWATTWMNSQPWLTVGNRHWYDNSDHILFFLPHAPVAGLAEVNGKLSWFGNDGAAWYSNTIHQHEIGHNIQLHHASHGAEEYGDESGLMGFTSYVSGAVDQDYRLCFNGAKSWQLGCKFETCFANRACMLCVGHGTYSILSSFLLLSLCW